MAQIVDGRDTATSLSRKASSCFNIHPQWQTFMMISVQDQYYPEIKELVSRESGAAFVQVLSHITRSEEQALQGKRLGAHRLVHNDFTSNLIKDGFFAALEEEGKYDMENGRICIFNLWRRFDADGLHAPLAVCDASSVTEAELIPLICGITGMNRVSPLRSTRVATTLNIAGFISQKCIRKRS